MTAGVTTTGKLASITVTVSRASPLTNKSNQRQRKRRLQAAVTQRSITEMTGAVGLMRTAIVRTQGQRF